MTTTLAMSSKPLIPRMIEILMDCHEKELMNLEPCNAGTLKYSKGLINRGMLKAAYYSSNKGKKIVGLYVTHLGKAYLRKL